MTLPSTAPTSTAPKGTAPPDAAPTNLGQTRIWGASACVAAAALAFDPSAASAATPKIALALVVALAALAPSLPRLWSERRPPPAGVVLWIALGAWSLITLSWSPHPDPTTPALWLAAGAIALAASGLSTAERRALTGRAALLVTAGASLVALAQRAGGAEGVAVHGAMGNPNWLGLSLACALPLLLGHAAHTRGVERALAIAASALGVPGLVLAQSRVALVALAVVAVALGAIAGARRAGRRRVGVVLIPLVALALWGARQWATPLHGRLWLSTVSLDAWLTAPAFGHGGGAFPAVFLDAQAARLAALPLEEAGRSYLFAQTAHADWLQLAVEGGAVALALGLLPFVVALGASTSTSSAAALAVVGVCMIGDSPLHQPAVVVLAALALADTRTLPKRHDRRDTLLAIAVAVALACLLPRATTTWLAERAAHAARDAEPAERLVALERAEGMAPWWGEPAFDQGITELERGDAERALAAFARAEDAGVVGPSLHLARGNALVAAGRPREATGSYEAALALHPASFRAHANLAEAARLAGDLTSAERHLAIATDLRPHHPKLAAIAESLRRSRIDHATTPAASPATAPSLGAGHDEARLAR